MGYRNYLSYMSKRHYNKIRTLTFDELKVLAIESAKGRGKLDSYNLNDVVDEDDDYDDSSYMIDEELVDLHLVQLYELGKYVDLGEVPKKSTKNFFTKKDSNLIVSNDDVEMIVVTKEFLKHIIEMYQGFIKKHYEQLTTDREKYNTMLRKMDRVEHSDWNKEDDYKLKPDQELTQEEITLLVNSAVHVKQVSFEWLQLDPFTLEENDDKICKSYRYEYAIFELVKIYKTFDWKRNILVYSGH